MSMRAYYECPVQAGLVVPGNGSKVFAIPYPTRVRLTKLNVYQTAGTPAGFKVDLYSAQVQDSPQNGDGLYQVGPAAIQGTAGLLQHPFPDVDTYFDNKDALVYTQAQGQNTPSLVSTAARRVIYVRITNQGSTQNTYSLILGSESM